MPPSSSTATARAPNAPRPPGAFVRFNHRIGTRTFEMVRFAGGFGLLSYQVFRELFTRPFYFRLFLEQLYLIGNRSFLMVMVIALATGSVMTLEYGHGLARFGGKLYVPKLVVLTILREMGPVFASMLLAARVGSGIAAEVASMKVTQQIDAIRALGTSPIKRIVIPRLLACLIAIPLLGLLANWIAMLGATAVATYDLGINAEYFISKSIDGIRTYDVWMGIVKCLVFAYFIGITSCWKGLNTEGGTQGVGNATTWVVVTTSIFIMISDFFLTKLFFTFVIPK